MYDPNALPMPPGMFGITSMPQPTAAPRPGTATNALAGLTRPTRQPGSVYGGGGMPSIPGMPGGMPAMPMLPNMPPMPGMGGGAGAGRPGMPAMPTFPNVPGMPPTMMPPGNTGVVPPGTPNSQVPGVPGSPGGAGSWFQQFMGPNGFDRDAFMTALNGWRDARRDWRDDRPQDRTGMGDWRAARPLPPWHTGAVVGASPVAAPAAPIATDPAAIAAAALPPGVYDPFGG